MNDSLTALYETYWKGFIDNVYKPYYGRCAYPFLIQVTQQYIDAPKRVMICGQETQGWGKSKDSDTTDVQDIQRMYYDFMDTVIRKKKRKSTPYWNFNKRLVDSNPNVGFVFQNVVKSGKFIKAGCDDEIYQLTKQYFPVWMEELKILKPDLIIFLTGKYDKRIGEQLGSFEKVSMGKDFLLDELRFENPLIPKAYRTNHPAYLQRNKNFFPATEFLSELIQNA